MRESILKAVFGGALAMSCIFSGVGCGEDSSDSAQYSEAALRGGNKAGDGGVAKNKCQCKGGKGAKGAESDEQEVDGAKTHGKSDAKGAKGEDVDGDDLDVDEEADEAEETEDSDDLDLQPLKKTSDGGVGQGKGGKPDDVGGGKPEKAGGKPDDVGGGKADDATAEECVCEDADGGASKGKSGATHGKLGKGGKGKAHGGPFADAGV